MIPYPCRFRTVVLLTLLCAGLFACTSVDETPIPKIPVHTLDDLPQHVYPVTGPVSEMVRSYEAMMGLARKVRIHIESDLALYDIQDATTLKNMYGSLYGIYFLLGSYEEALAYLDKIRELEDKEAAKLMAGLVTRAMIAAREECGLRAGKEVYHATFRKHLELMTAELPWEVVEDSIQENKGRLEIFSESLVLGLVQAQIDPVAEKTGEINAAQANTVLNMYSLLTQQLPLKEEIIAVYQELIDANTVVKEDIWADRAVTLVPGKPYTPVLFGVWDSGTDPKVFRELLYVNPKEKKNGLDDDNNGFVDDVHGIAYDIHAKRTTGELCPLGDAEGRMADIMKYVKGLTDLSSAVDSPEAMALKKHIASLSPDQVQPFIEDVSLAGNYCHGTHVAGIMVEGNPYARILVARLSYDHRMKPVARTLEWVAHEEAKFADTVDYLKKNGVRVVNMSWGESRGDIETSFEQNGIGATAVERREMAIAVFKRQNEALFKALEGAPEILFCCAAGNSDNDVEFDMDIPSSYELPNLITVGAVDQAGEPTSFTSFGRTVQVYANGYEVESYVPGGAREKSSGTSMASPNVANLAGKLLAMNPKLTPFEVIALIKSGSDRRLEGDMEYLLMNPKQTVELLDSEL